MKTLICWAPTHSFHQFAFPSHPSSSVLADSHRSHFPSNFIWGNQPFVLCTVKLLASKNRDLSVLPELPNMKNPFIYESSSDLIT